MSDWLVRLFALLVIGSGCLLGVIILQRSFRQGGGGPLLLMLLFIALGSGVSLALTERNFFTGDAFQPAMAIRATQGATAGILLLGIFSTIRHAPSLIEPERNLAAAIWAGFLAFFLLDTVLGSLFGTVRSFQVSSLYSVLVFAAIFVRPPSTERQFATAAKIALLAILYLSALKAFFDPYSVIEQPYIGLLPSLDFRYHGVTGHANVLGPVALGYLIVEYAYPSRNPFRVVNGAIAGLTLLFAQSKTAWMGALGFSVVFLYFQMISGSVRRVASLRLLAKGLFLLVALPGMLAFVALQIMELVQLSGKQQELSTFTGRTLIWQITYERFLDSPAFGYGPSLWGEEFRLHYNLPYAGQAHNQFIQTMGTGGVAGLVGLLIYLIFLAKASIRYAVVTRGATVAFLLMMLLHAFSEAPLRLAALMSGSGLLHLTFFAWLITLSKSRSRNQISRIEGRSSVD